MIAKEQHRTWWRAPRQNLFAFVENVKPLAGSFDSGAAPVIEFAYTETNGFAETNVNGTAILTFDRGPIPTVKDASFP